MPRAAPPTARPAMSSCEVSSHGRLNTRARSLLARASLAITLALPVVTIAHISDPHVGSPFFVPNLMNRVIAELNELRPDAVVVSGDLTADGDRQEYKNWAAYAEGIQAPMLTVPGNPDPRNAAHPHFQDP